MTLNGTSNKILDKKAAKFTSGSPFSIALIGDSHIGQKNCPNNANWYRELLNKIVSKKVYSIFHGGDSSDYGDGSLTSFVNITKNELKYNNITAARTPIFVNIGNHDYKLGSGTKAISRKDYNDLIGNQNSIIKLFNNGKGPRIAVVFLDTGANVSGKLPNGQDYDTVLKNIEDKMKAIIKNHSTVRFIIDMHVPPRISGNTNFNKSHVLLTKYDDKFRRFIKRFTSKYPGRILAIVAHHKHGWVQKNAYYYSYKSYDMKNHKIPVYVTAQGGHCDGNAPSNAQYSFYTMSFVKKTGSNHYTINKVSRFNLTQNPVTGKYKLSKAIPIGK